METISPAHKNSLASAQEQSRQRTSNIEYIYNKNNRGDNTPDPTSSKQIKLHSSEVIPPPISSKIFNFNFEDANNHALTTYSWNVEFIKEEFEKFQGYYNALEETQKANSEFFWKQWCKKVKKSDITRWEENQKVQNNNQLKADETESYEEITRGGWGELTNYTDKIERKMTSVIFQALSRNINITKEDQGYHLNFSITTNEIGSDFAKNISSDDWLWFAQDIAKKYQKPVKLFLYNFGKKFKTICSEFEQATKVWGIQEKNIYKTCANEQEKFCDFNDNIDVVETYITLPGEKKQLVKEPNYRTLQDALQPFIYDHIPEGTQVSIEVKLKDLSNDNFVNSTWKEFLKHVAQQHKTNCSYKILFYNNGQENREVSLTEEEARSHREFYYGTKANKINRINS